MRNSFAEHEGFVAGRTSRNHQGAFEYCGQAVTVQNGLKHRTVESGARLQVAMSIIFSFAAIPVRVILARSRFNSSHVSVPAMVPGEDRKVCLVFQTITRLAFSQVGQNDFKLRNNGRLRGLFSTSTFFPKFGCISRVYAPLIGDTIPNQLAAAEPFTQRPRGHVPDMRKLLRSEGAVICCEPLSNLLHTQLILRFSTNLFNPKIKRWSAKIIVDTSEKRGIVPPQFTFFALQKT